MNEPIREYAPGTPERGELRRRLDEMQRERIEIPCVIGGEEVRPGRPSRPSCRTGRGTCSRMSTRAARRGRGRSRPRRGLARLVANAVGGARSRLPPRRRAARGPVALDTERRDDARPVEDRAPGRDRRGLRGDRLLALQRRVHDADLRAAAGLLAGRLEPDGVPAARGVRLRRPPVQLHCDRRQPARELRADGQHGRLEAGLDGRLLGVLPDAALRRPASRLA